MDAFLLNGHGRATLPHAPESYFVLSLLFGTPHIIASNLIFFTNQDYLKTYWVRAAWMTVAIIGFFALGSVLLSYNVLFSIVATATVTHVVKQQIGIGNMVARISGRIHSLWIWTMIGSSVLMYNGIFLRNALSYTQLRWIDYSLAGSSLVLVAGALWCQGQAKSPLGARFLWANTVMVLASFYFYSQQYYFFAVLGPRIVHDVTAFIFYITHDRNRHGSAPRNAVYRVFSKIGVKALVAVPLMAIGTTLFLQEYADTYFAYLTQALFHTSFHRAIGFGFIGYLAMLHYYMEGITWKAESPYRRYLSFSP